MKPMPLSSNSKNPSMTKSEKHKTLWIKWKTLSENPINSKIKKY
jgi:hypothetical protein